MKYIRQFMIIILISFVGEVLHYLLPLPISASIYGLVLMLVGLASGLIPLAAVKDTAYFLVETMPLMFIPACWNPGQCSNRCADRSLRSRPCRP